MKPVLVNTTKPHPRMRDISGERVHALTAISWAGTDGKNSWWNTRCDCGTGFLMQASEFRKGKQKSCGCQRGTLISQSRLAHGMTDHPTYWVWRSMVDRCGLPSHQAWGNYGARGIVVCARWAASFEAFWEDMGPTYEPGLTLDRIDNDEPYAESNCRWTTSKVQGRNKRPNRLIETPWGVMTVSEASERSGIGKTTLTYRLNAGVTGLDLFVPPDTRNRFTTS